MRWPAATPLLLVAALASSACSRPRPIEARPALFVVRDADTQIWLFGTIHLLPADVHWQTPAIEQAIEAAGELVTELPTIPQAGAAATFEALATRDGLPPALARVAPGERAALKSAIAAADLSAAEADRLKSWALAVSIGSRAAQDDGATVADGVEAVLADRFRRAHKPRRGFETLAGQLALFDALPEPAQRALLAEAVRGLRDPATSYRATLAAWAAGDERRIAASFNPLLAGQPALDEALLSGRNRRWSRWIAARMARPGKLLVAVGAGHLAGPHSILAMLRARGLVVRRVQ